MRTALTPALLLLAITACDPKLIDEDGDGYLDSVDCDDTDPSIHPAAEEIEYDGIDQD